MIRLSERPACTDWITESTAEGAAAGFAAGGLAGAGFGATEGGGACAKASAETTITAATDFIRYYLKDA
jgi:hypothetical protein